MGLWPCGRSPWCPAGGLVRGPTRHVRHNRGRRRQNRPVRTRPISRRRARMPAEQFDFFNAEGLRLAGLLDNPAGEAARLCAVRPAAGCTTEAGCWVSPPASVIVRRLARVSWAWMGYLLHVARNEGVKFFPSGAELLFPQARGQLASCRRYFPVFLILAVHPDVGGVQTALIGIHNVCGG
jgi:hypothetical protein